MSKHNEKISIDVLSLSTYITNALSHAKINSLQDLQSLSVEELSKVRGIGTGSLQAILSACEQHSIYLPLKAKPNFMSFPYTNRIPRKTIAFLYDETELLALNDLPNHSTEELFEWCKKDIFHTCKIYKQLKAAELPTHISGSPFLFEVPSFPPIALSGLLFLGVYRMDAFLAMSQKELLQVRNIGKKRALQLVEFQQQYIIDTTN